MNDICNWSIEECKSWLDSPINKKDVMGTDDSFDRAFRNEVRNQYGKLIKKKETYIKLDKYNTWLTNLKIMFKDTITENNISEFIKYISDFPK